VTSIHAGSATTYTMN